MKKKKDEFGLLRGDLFFMILFLLFFLFRAINYDSFASVQHDLIALFSSDGQKTKIMPNSFMCKKSEIEKKELKSVPTPLPPAYNSHD